MGKIEIKIPNWAKFNPRSDRANYSWFRLDNSFFHDQSVFGLTSQDKLSYIFVLCELSKKNKDSVHVDVEYAAAMLRLKEDEFLESLKRLEESELIKTDLAGKKPSSRRRKAGIEPSLLPATRQTRRDETDVRDERSSPPPKGAAPVAELRDAFLEAYRKEFKRDYPGWGAKENGMASKWLKSVSLENAKRLAALFPKWNDPWVTKQGHPLGILVAQYVQLDAWAQSSKHLIQKIAAGKAAESVDLKRAIDFEENKRGLNYTIQQQERESLADSREFQEQLPFRSSKGIPSIHGDPFGQEIFDAPSESDSA